jgi:hypothetical protein
MNIDKFLSKKNELTNLVNYKIELINTLLRLDNEKKNLINPESKDWMVGFPIETLKQLESKSMLKTRLGDYRIRSEIIKTCNKTLDELDSVDVQIKLALFDLVSEKINITLSI